MREGGAASVTRRSPNVGRRHRSVAVIFTKYFILTNIFDTILVYNNPASSQLSVCGWQWLLGPTP
jgi:hypothetical protein